MRLAAGRATSAASRGTPTSIGADTNREPGISQVHAGETPDAGAEQGRRRPVVRLVDAILSYAVHRGASDTHIGPEEGQRTIPFRGHGRPQLVCALERDLLPAATARIKIAGGMAVEPYVTGSTLVGVTVQRLFRLSCPHCPAAGSM